MSLRSAAPSATVSPMSRGALDTLRGWFRGLPSRDRRAVWLAGWVLGLFLLGWLGIAPALTTLRAAPEQHARLDAELSRMRAMAARAAGLREQPATLPSGRDATLRALEQATSLLSSTAQLSVLGDRVTVTLQDTPADALAWWLTRVRTEAGLLPLEARISRAPSATGTPGWTGTLLLTGPGLASGR